MQVENHELAEREAQRVQANREELVERIARAVPEDGVVEPLEGLHLARVSVPLQRIHSVLEPSLCVIAQGSKEVLLGDSRYRYDPAHYLIATLGAAPHQPGAGSIEGAALSQSAAGTRPCPRQLGHG